MGCLQMVPSGEQCCAEGHGRYIFTPKGSVAKFHLWIPWYASRATRFNESVLLGPWCSGFVAVLCLSTWGLHMAGREYASTSLVLPHGPSVAVVM